MIPNPILKVLSTLSTHRVRYLLMGGQACVFYGAAEFSRDCDIAVLCEPENLDRLRAALAELQAVTIAVPPFESDFLVRGHAVHFRCRAPGADNLRLDVMAKMRGVDPFDQLWARRTSIDTDEPTDTIELMSLPDLIAAKRTQRDKDWPMIRRLVEAHFAQHQADPSEEHLSFWLANSRTPRLLISLAAKYPATANKVAAERPLLRLALANDPSALTHALASEQEAERVADERYWEPLKRELEHLRHHRD